MKALAMRLPAGPVMPRCLGSMPAAWATIRSDYAPIVAAAPFPANVGTSAGIWSLIDFLGLMGRGSQPTPSHGINRALALLLALRGLSA